MERHALIVAIDPGSLLGKEGVEVGDILDELCGEQVIEDTHGKVGMANMGVVIVQVPSCVIFDISFYGMYVVAANFDNEFHGIY